MRNISEYLILLRSCCQSCLIIVIPNMSCCGGKDADCGGLSSCADLDEKSVAVAKHMSGEVHHDDDDDDDWAEDVDDDSHMVKHERRAFESIHHNTGYREAIQAATERARQEGFDLGFGAGATAGRHWGELRGILELFAARMPAHPRVDEVQSMLARLVAVQDPAVVSRADSASENESGPVRQYAELLRDASGLATALLGPQVLRF
ncbi:hypothetical protein CAOG_009533 [Capsaspora owczarzaki ATCC 30864]|uniref:Uncharacterized protein n=1 Tax=Capsaspora owczarzaki (strain ATCC 30864) TaxID=595528 RepID=A0A0D2U7U8_CAPO3|nr:hypothetical protein CAOG_009533 [Capsaspora owczarzaki ATCC 30864]